MIKYRSSDPHVPHEFDLFPKLNKYGTDVCEAVCLFPYENNCSPPYRVSLDSAVGLWCPTCKAHKWDCFGEQVDSNGLVSLSNNFLASSLKPRSKINKFSSIDLIAITYNVQSLLDPTCDAYKSTEEYYAIGGARSQTMADALNKNSVHVACFQETRTKCGKGHKCGFHVISSGRAPGPHRSLGCEIWLNLALPFRYVGEEGKAQ